MATTVEGGWPLTIERDILGRSYYTSLIATERLPAAVRENITGAWLNVSELLYVIEFRKHGVGLKTITIPLAQWDGDLADEAIAYICLEAP